MFGFTSKPVTEGLVIAKRSSFIATSCSISAVKAYITPRALKRCLLINVYDEIKRTLITNVKLNKSFQKY